MQCIQVNDYDSIITGLPDCLTGYISVIEEYGFAYVLSNVKRRKHNRTATLLERLSGNLSLSGYILLAIKNSFYFEDNRVTRLHFVLRNLGDFVIIGGRTFILNFSKKEFSEGPSAFNMCLYTMTLYEYTSNVLRGEAERDIMCVGVDVGIARDILDNVLTGLKYVVHGNNVILKREDLLKYLTV